MGQVRWDLKEIPSIHSAYVNQFVQEIHSLEDSYRQVLAQSDLKLLLPDRTASAVTGAGSADSLMVADALSDGVGESRPPTGRSSVSPPMIVIASSTACPASAAITRA